MARHIVVGGKFLRVEGLEDEYREETKISFRVVITNTTQSPVRMIAPSSLAWEWGGLDGLGGFVSPTDIVEIPLVTKAPEQLDYAPGETRSHVFDTTTPSYAIGGKHSALLISGKGFYTVVPVSIGQKNSTGTSRPVTRPHAPVSATARDAPSPQRGIEPESEDGHEPADGILSLLLPASMGGLAVFIAVGWLLLRKRRG